MKKNTFTTMLLGVFTATAVYLGYKIATDVEFRGRLTMGARDAVDMSKKKMETMSEDVALRTAQLTRNPQINQDWVEHQWEALGV